MGSKTFAPDISTWLKITVRLGKLHTENYRIYFYKCTPERSQTGGRKCFEYFYENSILSQRQQAGKQHKNSKRKKGSEKKKKHHTTVLMESVIRCYKETVNWGISEE